MGPPGRMQGHVGMQGTPQAQWEGSQRKHKNNAEVVAGGHAAVCARWARYAWVHSGQNGSNRASPGT